MIYSLQASERLIETCQQIKQLNLSISALSTGLIPKQHHAGPLLVTTESKWLLHNLSIKPSLILSPCVNWRKSHLNVN